MPSHAATKVPSTGQPCLAFTIIHAIPSFHTSAQHLLQQHAPLGGHGRRHGEDELVALGSGHKGQGNAGVAAGRLNQDSLRGAWRQRHLVSAQSQCRGSDGLKYQSAARGCPIPASAPYSLALTLPGKILPAFSASSIIARPIL